MFDDTKTLIIVYKNELVFNYFRKIIETFKKNIKIISWSEKIYLAQMKSPKSFNNKVVFLGSFKGAKALEPILDVQYDEYGVKFGVAGNRSLLIVHPKSIESKEMYLELLDKIKELNIPEVYKKDYYIEYKKGAVGFSEKLDQGFDNLMLWFKRLRVRDKLESQMLFYGATVLFNNYLDGYVD